MLAVLLVLFPSVILADETLNAQMNLAKHGNAEAQFKVGEMYENGTGVRQDKREARYWFTRSANQGYELAGFKLLYMDLEAKGLKGENNARLEELNTKAKNGNSQAQLYLGKMYANGIGISKNPDAAIDWLSKSASAGVLEAELELAVVKVEKQRDQQNETRFETNPCSSKSAAFLSTCK